MTREKILRKALEMSQHNLYCYSQDFACTLAKIGHETNYTETKEQVEILKVWLSEFHSSSIESTIEFIGYISGWGTGKTYDGYLLADTLEFEVNTGTDRYAVSDNRLFKIGIEAQKWFIGKNGKCGLYDIEKDKQDSRLIKITVNSINYVISIEWVENN